MMKLSKLDKRLDMIETPNSKNLKHNEVHILPEDEKNAYKHNKHIQHKQKHVELSK